MARNPEGKRVGWLGRIARIVKRVVVGAFVALILALVLYRFVPAPSTLMLARWATFRPVERQWVPISAISPHLIRAVIAAEDQRFCQHAGIDWAELNAVLQDEDGPSRGASTLTMQTAKNLFLWPGRSYLRKGLELPLALAIDLAWPKRRVIEVYLNIAEWGDGVFGAEAAAQRYFNKSAAQITPAEAARLAGALPNPILRDPSRPSRGLTAAARRVQARSARLGALGDCALARANPGGEQPVFRLVALAIANESV